MLFLFPSPGLRSRGPGASRASALSYLFSGSRPAILSVGHDRSLLATRAAVLAVSGCEIISANPTQAYTAAETRCFQLGVLGHTLTDREAGELAVHLRWRIPQIRLLATCCAPRPEAVSALFDKLVESRNGPVALLAAVHALLEQTKGDGGAGRDRTGA